MRKLTSILAVSAVVALAAVAVAQDKAPGAKPAAAAAPAKTADKGGAPASAPGGMTPEQLEKMMAAGTPGPHHKHLEAFNGKWNAVCKTWMNGPDSTPDESTATAEFKMTLDGRVQHQTFAGSFGGMPFTGMGICGYDNTSKKYWSMWTDTMSTNYMMQTGTVDATGKVFTYQGSFECPVFGACTAKSALKWTSPDVFVYSMDMTTKSGPPHKMEITYTRAK